MLILVFNQRLCSSVQSWVTFVRPFWLRTHEEQLNISWDWCYVCACVACTDELIFPSHACPVDGWKASVHSWYKCSTPKAYLDGLGSVSIFPGSRWPGRVSWLENILMYSLWLSRVVWGGRGRNTFLQALLYIQKCFILFLPMRANAGNRLLFSKPVHSSTSGWGKDNLPTQWRTLCPGHNWDKTTCFSKGGLKGFWKQKSNACICVHLWVMARLPCYAFTQWKLTGTQVLQVT